MNHRVIHRNYEPAMTFKEIAAVMGLDRRTVFVIYARAMFKIRRYLQTHPGTYETMVGLTAMRQRGETTFPDWAEANETKGND